MNISLMPYLIVWIFLALVVLALIVYHNVIAHQEDETMKFGINVQEPAAVEQRQTTLESKLHIVDKWGKILTVIAVVYGLLLAALYVYQAASAPRGI